MKVLIVHNAYQQYGGEDTVVRMECELLEKSGNLAGAYLVSNDIISGLAGKLGAALNVVFSRSSFRSARSVIRELKPDVVHVHNFFPLISPSIFYACRAEKVPVVFTLHNYRIACPTALLMHDGQVTEKSLSNGPWWALRHRVYRDSWVGTFLLCFMIWLHDVIGTWRTKVDRFIALTDFGKSRFIKAGLPPDRISVKPNFVDIPAVCESSSERQGFLYVGRLSTEKGVETLAKAAQQILDSSSKGTLRVVGSGPLSKSAMLAHLNLLGALGAEDVRQEMERASVLVMPSIWYEGLPMVLVEAYACGLPVIASRIGALAELVEDNVTGLLFEPGNADELAGKMAWALAHPEEIKRMGEAARKRYEALYTPKRNYEQLMAIYRDVIDGYEH